MEDIFAIYVSSYLYETALLVNIFVAKIHLYDEHSFLGFGFRMAA